MNDFEDAPSPAAVQDEQQACYITGSQARRFLDLSGLGVSSPKCASQNCASKPLVVTPSLYTAFLTGHLQSLAHRILTKSFGNRCNGPHAPDLSFNMRDAIMR